MKPRYIRIAIDIAESITNQELKVGAKITGRSTLASKYNVSPETIRKSIALLKDYEVVSSSPKEGILVLNEENSALFLTNMKYLENYSNLKTEIQDLIKQQKELNTHIMDKINLVIESYNKPKRINSFSPYELLVPENSHLIHTTIGNSNFWNNTGATIVTIIRKDKKFISPGPNFKFKQDDSIYFVCKNEYYNLTRSFIEQKK